MDNTVKLLKELADKLGQTIESLWPHAVRYEAINALTVIFIWAIIWAVITIILWKSRKENFYDDYSQPTLRLYFAVVTAIITVLFSVSAAINIPIFLEPVGYLTIKILGH